MPPPPRGPPPAKPCTASSSGLKGDSSIAASGLLRQRQGRDGLEVRQGFDTPQPSEHRRVFADGNTAFGRMPDIGVTGEVGNGGVFGRKKIAGLQVLVHE